MNQRAVTLQQAKAMFDRSKGGSSAYDSVEAMAADEGLAVGMYCTTAGYYAPGDGGGGMYRIDEVAEADGGLVIALKNGNTARLIVENDTVSAKQYGCRIDGVTDDTVQANRFLKLAEKYKYRLCFGRSDAGDTMLVSDTLVIHGYGNDAHVEIDFEGMFLKYTGDAGNAALVIYNIKNAGITGLTFHAGSTDGHYIRIFDSSRTVLTHMRGTKTILKIGGAEERYAESSGVVLYLNFDCCQFAQVQVDEVSSFVNCLNFRSTLILVPSSYGVGKYDYAVVLNRRVGGMSFIDCDISYSNAAKIKLSDLTAMSTILLMNCYFDSSDPIVENNSCGNSIINVVGCYNGQNQVYFPAMGMAPYSRCVQVGDVGRAAGSVAAYAVNLCKNGLFLREDRIDDEKGYYYGVQSMELTSAEIIRSSEGRFGKAMRVRFDAYDAESGTHPKIFFEAGSAPVGGAYAGGFRVIKRSGTSGKVQIGIAYGASETVDVIDVADMADGESYMMTMCTGRNADVAAGEAVSIMIAVAYGDECVLDICEVGVNYGQTYIPGLPTHEELCTVDQIIEAGGIAPILERLTILESAIAGS